MIGTPNVAFIEIAPRFLFEVDHAALRRGRSAVPGRLADYLDALNLAAGDWIEIDTLTERILGPASGQVWDRRPSSLYACNPPPGLVRPLLESDDNGLGSKVMKSPLWHQALQLPSDEALRGPARPR